MTLHPQTSMKYLALLLIVAVFTLNTGEVSGQQCAGACKNEAHGGHDFCVAQCASCAHGAHCDHHNDVCICQHA